MYHLGKVGSTVEAKSVCRIIYLHYLHYLFPQKSLHLGVYQPNSLGYYRDCKDAFEQGQTCSGVYTINPHSTEDRFSALVQPPFDVYCDMETDGGGWTVFQRRMDGSQNFYLHWNDYVHGFGNLNGEFWLGLSKIHCLTANTSHTNMLRVDLGDFDCNTRYAKYTIFRVGDSVSKYTLTVYGYTGTAIDSLAYHNGRQFSTRDQDNDDNSGHCAQKGKGGWWYGSCHHSNLNGHYYPSGPYSSTYAAGVNWKFWKGLRYSLKVTEMKVRRV